MRREVELDVGQVRTLRRKSAAKPSTWEFVWVTGMVLYKGQPAFRITNPDGMPVNVETARTVAAALNVALP